MRVLHLPFNIASQISITVRALRGIGVEARGLVLNGIPQQDDREMETYGIHSPAWRQPFRFAGESFRWLRAFRSAVRWAEVIHWHYTDTNALGLDLKYIAHLNKPRLVEFWGTDIRDPARAVRDNPYLSDLVRDREAYPISSDSSEKVQKIFSEAGFGCLIPGPELFDYLRADLFPAPIRTEAALPIAEYRASYPDPEKRKPVVCHIPSRPKIKGTEQAVSAVRHLSREVDFEFRLLEGISHSKALEAMAESDIVLDQFIIGSYGTVTLEAMALGKPVLCYIKPAFLKRLPRELPIVNANPDNLESVLGDLLRNGRLRHTLGRRSRLYAEKFHDSRIIAGQLKDVYRQEMDRRTKK